MKILTGALVACVACGGAAVNEAKAPAPAPAKPLEGYTLVWRGAWLQSGIKPDAPRARAYELAAITYGAHDEVGEAFAMRVVRDEGEFVELTNLPGADVEATGQCYGSVPGLVDLELHLFAARSSLRDVTTRAVKVQNDNGTGFELSAGVALGPSEGHDKRGRPLRALSVDDVQAVIHLPEDAIGGAYGVATPFPPLGADAVTLEDQQGAARLGMDAGEPRTGVIKWPEGTRVTADPAPHDQVLATLQSHCARLRTLVNMSQVSPVAVGHGVGLSRGSTSDLARVKEGAELSWPDGSPAGKVLVWTQIFSEVTKDGDRRCWKQALRSWRETDEAHPTRADEKLPLCVGVADYIPGYGEKP